MGKIIKLGEILKEIQPPKPPPQPPIYTCNVYIENVLTSVNGEIPVLFWEALYQRMSYEIPGAFFSQQFQNKHWDGRKHLFNKRHLTFPTGLFSILREVAADNRVELKVSDLRQKPSLGKSIPLIGISLRDYQLEAVDAILKKQRGMIRVATGGGKSLIAAELIGRLNIPTLVLIHKQDIFHQLVQTFKSSLGVKIGQIGCGIVYPEEITVGMIQTIHKAYGGSLKGVKDIDDDITVIPKPEIIKQFVERVGCVIVDEAHHCSCNIYDKVMRECGKAYYRVGFSATPFREDNADILLDAHTGARCVDLSASDLIVRGYLSKPTIYLWQFDHGRPTAYGYPHMYEQQVVNNIFRNRLVIKSVLKAMAAKKTSLVAVTRIEHGKLLEAMLKECVPGKVRFASGQIDSLERKQILADLNDRKIDVVIATTVFGEGIDCFNGETLVHTSQGVKEIANISKGDYVLGGSGTFEKVDNTIKKPYKGDLFSIKAAGMLPLKVTPNHPILAIPSKECIYKNSGTYTICHKCSIISCKDAFWKHYKKEWILAKDLKLNDLVAVKIPIFKKNIEKNIDIVPLLQKRKTFNIKSDKEKVWLRENSSTNRFLDLEDPDTYRLFGFFLSEGHADKGRVSFAFHTKETEYHKDIMQLGKRILGVNGIKIIKGNSTVIRFHRSWFKDIFDSLTDRTVNKKIPSFVFGASRECKGQLIKGMIQGDGHFCKKYSNGTIRYVSQSKKLIMQLRDLLLSEGIYGSIIFMKSNNTYGLNISGPYLSDLASLCKMNVYSSSKRKFKYHYSFEEGYIFVPIKTIETSHYDGFVYDVTLPESHSLSANGLIAHNCPSLDVLINAKANQSSVDSLQLIGRALRKTPTKNRVTIVDIYDDHCKYLGKHAKSRLNIYKTEPEFEIRKIKDENDLRF